MKLDANDLADLRPLIVEAVRATLVEVQVEQEKLNGRIGYPEAEAAALLGVERHILRDCRLRREIAGRTIGRRVVYSREALVAFVNKT